MATFNNILDNPVFTPALKSQIEAVTADQLVTQKYVSKVIRGVYKHGMLIGAPGLGKSYAVQQALTDGGLIDRKDYMIVKGHCTPGALFKLLYLYRKPGQVLVLDDCDVETDKIGMDLIKAATDPDNSRVNWTSSAQPVIGGEVVSDFVFKGTLIICTNDFRQTGRSSTKDVKKEAIVSRVRPRYVDFNSIERKFAQCYNMVVNAGYLDSNPATRLTDEQKVEMLEFMIDNLDNFASIDLRLPQKLAADIVDDPLTWREYAQVSLFRK